jgi:hypothetical protein
MSYVVVNLSLFVVVCTARQGFLFCNKIINPIEILGRGVVEKRGEEETKSMPHAPVNLITPLVSSNSFRL